jgi:hypothetical protein
VQQHTSTWQQTTGSSKQSNRLFLYPVIYSLIAPYRSDKSGLKKFHAENMKMARGDLGMLG